MRFVRRPPMLPSWRQGFRPHREEVVIMKKTLMHLCAFGIGVGLILAGTGSAFADFDAAIGPNGEGDCDSEVGELLDMDKLSPRTSKAKRFAFQSNGYTETSMPLLLIVVSFTRTETDSEGKTYGKISYLNNVDWNQIVFTNDRASL